MWLVSYRARIVAWTPTQGVSAHDESDFIEIWDKDVCAELVRFRAGVTRLEQGELTAEERQSHYARAFVITRIYSVTKVERRLRPTELDALL